MKTKKTYFGFRVTQRVDKRAVKFFVFVAEATDILQWAMIDRVQKHRGGIQRPLSEARARAITGFFADDPINTTPTAVVLAFKRNKARFSKLTSADIPDTLEDHYEWGRISFEFDADSKPIHKPAVVVDGQHRLHGMAQYSNESLPVLVSALLDATNDELAFQFIVVNNKATRVSADVVRSLVVDFDASKLDKRLETARVSLKPQALLVRLAGDNQSSPLYHMIAWPHQRGKGVAAVRPQAVEDSLRYIRGRFDELDRDEDALIEFFFAMWNGIQQTYPQLWRNIDNHLLDNAGFKAMSEYLTDQIDTQVIDGMIHLEDSSQVTESVKKIASQITAEFWTSNWQLKGLDTQAGRELIKDDLRMLRINYRQSKDWREQITVIGSGVE